MTDQKFFRNALSAYSYQMSNMAAQVHEACVAHYRNDAEERERLKAEAKESYAQARFLWNCVPAEEQDMFVELMADIEA